MPIVFHYLPASGPCRAVEMTANHLGIHLEKRHVDLFAGEQMTPEFLEMNPMHCVPTIDDDGFYLWESRAIQAYLVNKYAPDSPIYPKCPKQRAVVDKILYFDIGTLFKAFAEYIRPIAFGNKPAQPEQEENLKKALGIFEKILEKTTYAAGDHLTIADFAIMSNLVFAEEVVGYSFKDFPKVSAWLARLKKEIPKYEEINEIPLREFKEFLKKKKLFHEQK